MMKGSKGILLISVISAFLFSSYFLQAETGTVRERAEMHFGLVKWTDAGDIPPAVPMDASVVPGGSETFPALGADSAAGVPAIYPSLPDTGALDYTDIDQGLLDTFSRLAAGLKELKIDSAVCIQERPFIPVIVNYQLEKLPAVDKVFFSRPSADDTGLWSSIFRMQFTDGTSRNFVIVHVNASQSKGNWYVTEIYFDGETYAALARQD